MTATRTFKTGAARKRASIAGLSLMEVIIAMAILGITASLMTVGVRMMNGFKRQSLMMESQREAQAVLATVVNDVRNAKYVVWVSSDALILRTFNLKLLDNLNDGSLSNDNDMFQEANLLTVTYRFAVQNGEPGLLRRIQRPAFNGAAASDTSILLLKGKVVRPAFGKLETYLFNPRPDAFTASTMVGKSTDDGIDGVDVTLNLAGKFGAPPLIHKWNTAGNFFTRSGPLTFRGSAILRTKQ